MTFKARAGDKTHDLVSWHSDLWSDDSSFYGDADTKAECEAEVASFNPRELWDVHEWNFQCIIAQENTRSESLGGVKRKRGESMEEANCEVQSKKVKKEDGKPNLSDASTATASPSPTISKEPFNPYEDSSCAYQLSETLDEFFARLPPSNTTTTQCGPWIYIADPYARRRHTFDDIGGFKQECLTLLEEFMVRKRHIEDENPDAAAATITRKLKSSRDVLESEIVRIAKARNVTCGKWMLFPIPKDVDRVWKVVARGTLEGKLGCAAKVAAKDENSGKPERLICIYTDDFSDKTDVERVLLEMKDLGLQVSGKDGRGIYYKCDAYTYLDITSGNDFKLKASMYSSNDMLGLGQGNNNRGGWRRRS